METEKIVADGYERLWADPGNQKRIEQAVLEIEAKYERESAGLSRIARAKRWFRMRREIRAAVAKIAPSSACYIKR